MTQGIARSGRGVTTTDHLRRSQGERCAKCSEFAAVLYRDANGKMMCVECLPGGDPGLIEVLPRGGE